MNKLDLDKKTKTALHVLMLLVLLGSTYYLASLIFGRGIDVLSATEQIDAVFLTTLADAGVDSAEIRKNYVRKQNGGLDWQQVEVVVALDESQSLYDLSESLRGSLDATCFRVAENKLVDDAAMGELQLSVYYDEMPIYQMLLKQTRTPPLLGEETVKERPKVALVVDDVGYDLERALDLVSLGRPMTIAILPQLKYSRHIAQVAHEMGCEIMLHLPMEPDEQLRRSPGFITPNMNEEELHWVLDRDLKSIPYVTGVNNHQGSKMTTEEEALAPVMRYLAGKDLFFIDSRTTSDSVAYRVAKEFGLPAAENNIFLDNEKDVEYIKGQIEKLMNEAEERGRAIGICHLHPVTIRALQEMFPIMDEREIELVHVSELVN